MSGLTIAHLDVLEAAIAETTSRTAKRKLREVLLVATQQVTDQLHQSVKQHFQSDAEAPLLEEDLQLVEQLMHKGVMHNAVIPELSAPDIARAVAIVTTLCIRANCSALEVEDQHFLEWMFDQAAEEPSQRAQARRLEKIVRGGLGLEQRLVWSDMQQRPLS